MELNQKIESILFYLSEPVSFSKLSKILNVKESEIKEEILILKAKLENRGIELVLNSNSACLAFAKENLGILEQVEKEKLNSDLSKATLETLSIIVYSGPISEEEISFIRGVNSSFILKNLKIRGLIAEAKGKFEASINLLRFLGISQAGEIKNYKEMGEKINQILSSGKE